MAKVAATHLYLTTRSGEVHAFAPGDALPSWAQRVITNPAAITDDAARPAAQDEPPQGDPSDAWKLDDLKAYAAEQGIDVTGVRAKAGVLEAIAAAAAPAAPAAPAEAADPVQTGAPTAPAAGSDAEDDTDEDDELSPVFDPSA